MNKPYFKTTIELMALGMIPITEEISKILGYNSEVKNIYHCSSYKFLDNMKDLQNTKNQICAFTKGLEKILNSIINTSDLMFKLNGNVIIEFDRDIYSHYDENGIRWLSIKNHKNTSFLKEAINFKVIKMMNNELDPHDVLDNPELYIKLFNDLNDNEKSKTIQYYFKRCSNLLKNNLYKKIVKEIINDKPHSGYDELIVNYFKVIGVYSLENGKYKYNYETAKKDIESKGFKYLGHIFREDFKNF